MNSQMIRVISSPSISTTGLAAANRLAGAASVMAEKNRKIKFNWKNEMIKIKRQERKVSIASRFACTSHQLQFIPNEINKTGFPRSHHSSTEKHTQAMMIIIMNAVHDSFFFLLTSFKVLEELRSTAIMTFIYMHASVSARMWSCLFFFSIQIFSFFDQSWRV